MKALGNGHYVLEKEDRLLVGEDEGKFKFVLSDGRKCKVAINCAGEEDEVDYTYLSISPEATKQEAFSLARHFNQYRTRIVFIPHT